MHWAQWLVIDQAKPILKNGAIEIMIIMEKCLIMANKH